MIIILPLIMIFLLLFLIFDKCFITNDYKNNNQVQHLIRVYEQKLIETNDEIDKNNKKIRSLKAEIKKQGNTL